MQLSNYVAGKILVNFITIFQGIHYKILNVERNVERFTLPSQSLNSRKNSPNHREKNLGQ